MAELSIHPWSRVAQHEPDMCPPSFSLQQVHSMVAMANHTVGMESHLMAFSETKELQVAQGFLFLLIYLVALVGNLLIIILVTMDQCVHTPMYFFLRNLSLLDVCLSQSLSQTSF